MQQFLRALRDCCVGLQTLTHEHQRSGIVSSEASIRMVRRVCASFPGAFCLYEAAYRLQELYPEASREASIEGWNHLVHRGYLTHGANPTWTYHLASEDREDSQSPGCG